MADIDATIAQMRQKFYRVHKRVPKQLHIGEERVTDLIVALPELREASEEELWTEVQVYGMKLVKHPDKRFLGVAG